MGTTGKVQCVLSCGCVRWFPSGNAPHTGDHVYCHYHGTGVDVIAGVVQYRIQCAKCRYGRQFGRNKDLAMHRAGEHLRKHGTHVVKVYDGQTLVDIVTQQHAPKLLDIPPEHQQSLRDVVERYRNVTKTSP